MSEHDNEFDPGEHTAPQVVDYLADADEEDPVEDALDELGGDTLEAADVRMDASGRVLSPWESAPKATDT